MTRRVLVTRPEPGASATATALRAAGFEPVIASLSEIRPLPVDGDTDIGHVDAVAVTSANAIRHAPQRLLGSLADLPLFAVGEATSTAATAAGFRTVVAGPGEADGLAGLVRDRIPAGSTILYLCGKVRRPDFEQGLESAGMRTSILETYDTRKPGSNAAFQRILDANSPLLAILLHSSEAAKALSANMSQTDVATLLTDPLIVVISNRAAAPLRDVFAGRIRIAREPTDAAMISVLKAAS